MPAGISGRLVRRASSVSHASASARTPRLMWLLGILLTLCFLTLVLYPPGLGKTLEYAAYDEIVRLLPGEIPPPDVAVIDVDERSLATLGQWPWPRYRLATLIEKASELGARSIALDFLLSEPDRFSLNAIQDLYSRDTGITLAFSGVKDDALDNDRVLAESVDRHNVVLGGDMIFEESSVGVPAACGRPLSVALRSLPGAEGEPPVPVASSMVCPVPELARAAHFVAAADSLPDRDGKLRRTPLVLRVGDQWVPSLALGALMAASGETQLTMLWSVAGVQELRLRDTAIPTDYQGSLLLPYRMRPPDRFKHISAVDLLEGRIERERLEGKIIFVGSSASGLQDMHPTPNMRLCPGVDLQALAADAILRGDFFVEPGWSRGVQALLVVAAGLLVTGLVAWTPALLSAFTTAGVAVAVGVGSWAIFNRWGVYFSPVPGMGMLLVSSTLLTLVRLRYQERRKQLLKKSFERYVSAEIVDQILQSSKPVNVSGERRMVTILMSDIRGFTPLSESMEAEELVQFLNGYFAAMIDIILANEGTLDKFMGDAVMALFGAPVSHGDDSLRAVKVALAMQEKLRELNTQWMTGGKPKIRVGIGISTGEVIVGNIGSAKRLEYTAIGQDVNYAQRIEGLTKDLPSDILVNETTYEQVKNYVDAEKFGPLTIKGKETPIFVYAIKGLVGRPH